MAEKDEFERKQKQLQKVCTPIVTKLGAGGGMPGGAGTFPGAGSAGGPSAGSRGKRPTIEEVD